MNKLNEMKEMLEEIKSLANDGVITEVEVIEEEAITKPAINEFANFIVSDKGRTIIDDSDLANQILSFQVFDKFRKVQPSKLNAEALYDDMKKIGKLPIDRSNIEQRIAVVEKNATNIAAAMDNYNPDIIDSMLRMEVVDVALDKNTVEDETAIVDVDKNLEYVDTMFKALVVAASQANFNKKK